MFAIGFGIIYFILLFIGTSFYFIIVFAILFFLLQWYISPKIIKMISHLEYIKNNEYQELHEIVNRLATLVHVNIPKIAIAPSKEPNAFVFGRSKKNSTLVIHKGLLEILNTEELESVIGHELGHLKHNDMLIITFISFIPMLAYLIAQSLFFSTIFGGIGNNRRNFDYFILFGIGAFFVYLISQLLLLSLSRTRELYADEFSAKTTKNPSALASSLFKISYNNIKNNNNKKEINMQFFYIIDFFSIEKDLKEIKTHYKEIKEMLPNIDLTCLVNDASKQKKSFWGILNSLYSTHPKTYKRILNLAKIKKTL